MTYREFLEELIDDIQHMERYNINEDYCDTFLHKNGDYIYAFNVDDMKEKIQIFLDSSSKND